MASVIRFSFSGRMASGAVFTAAAIVLFALALASPARAATFEVTKEDDPIPDGCQSTDCSLREAVIAANATTEADTITVPSGTYTLAIPGSDEDVSTPVPETGDLDITGSVTVAGDGAGQTIIEAGTVGTEGTPNGIDRVFDVRFTASETTFSGLTVRNGNVIGDTGGGIDASGSAIKVTIEECVISGNTARDANGSSGRNGGGVALGVKEAVIKNSTFSNNDSTGGAEGGGLYVSSPSSESKLTISGSRFSGNEASSGGGLVILGVKETSIEDSVVSTNTSTNTGGLRLRVSSGNTANVEDVSVTDNAAPGSFAGGMHVIGDGEVNVRDSVVSGNEADTSGGGVEFTGDSSGASLNVTDTTISDNVSGSSGGGVFHAAAGALDVSSTTVSGNEAVSGGGIQSVRGATSLVNTTISGNEATDAGAAIHNFGVLRAANATITENTGPSGAVHNDAHDNASGSATIKNSIIAGNEGGDTSGGNFTFTGENLLGVDAKLAPLAGNGGPTKTHALMSGSPAIDGVRECTDLETPPGVVDADQRGVDRPRGEACDIGAFERKASSPPPDPNECTIVGTNRSEILRGTPGRDVICAGGGGDIVRGLGGNDRLVGGAGNDILYGGAGRDVLSGGAGNDILKGGPGKDILIGGPGKDVQKQ